MLQTAAPTDPAADLRAEVARRQVPLYRLAPLVGLHPSHLGQVLRGRRPLTPELAQRIERALTEGSAPGVASLSDAAA
jgi:DNA-binding transcriptional regulator YdaS (Cro superfamily)